MQCHADVNCDGKVSLSDVVKVLQYITNAEQYPLSEQGKLNADVDGKDGITGADALAIQQMDLN